ncbi:fatty acid cis/trans isomerase [Vibrio sp. RC27]
MLRHLNIRVLVSRVLLVSLFSVLVGCSVENKKVGDQSIAIDHGLLSTLPNQPISYTDIIKPILESRCIACHGCYDAPCQLKLTSMEGIERGGSKDVVYNGTRIFGAPTTRLFLDAETNQQWRDKGFHTVLNETDNKTPTENLQQSTLFRILQLKQQFPQARTGKLSTNFSLGLNREQVCSKPSEFSDFSADHPTWGMPYAMPNLTDEEYTYLVHWIAQGSPASDIPKPSSNGLAQVKQWEAFLNQPSNKAQLMSRYLYEHLYHAHIHFLGAPEREFFQLVRSKTPAGQPIEVIATTRPFDDPGVSKVYYRLRPYHSSIVAKSHLVYQFSPNKLTRYKDLFMNNEYQVTELPSYDLAIASNPFKVFEQLPANARYRFLLDDAQFYIEGFIKGPVCRGQVALNVIEEQFWVFFFNPDLNIRSSEADFLSKYSNELDLPAAQGDTLNIISTWTTYKEKLEEYTQAKQRLFVNDSTKVSLQESMVSIWDGNGTNPNAALTIFRHFDSASVNQGLSGSYPETAWVIDYPLLERIHYLLVAGFNVYGNVGHQLNTRLYMDFLRMEGEDNYLAYLPAKQRKEIRSSWYQGIREDLENKLKLDSRWLDKEIVIGYQTADVQQELYQALQSHLGPMAGRQDNINRCDTVPCLTLDTTEHALTRIAKMKGPLLQVFPDVTFLRIKGKESRAYTLIRNKSYKNVSSMLADPKQNSEDLENDTLTVMPGLYGAYPNFFFEVDEAKVEEFVSSYTSIRTYLDYELFVHQYGVRRTNPNFWKTVDWFQAYNIKQNPIRAGIFDLNRYENR